MPQRLESDEGSEDEELCGNELLRALLRHLGVQASACEPPDDHETRDTFDERIETEPDQTYEVRFNMAGDPDAAPSLKTVIVSLGAETRIFTFDTAGRKGTDMGWASRTHVFKASGKTSTLAFRSPKDKCSAPAVDNVRVDPIAVCVQTHTAAGGCVNAH